MRRATQNAHIRPNHLQKKPITLVIPHRTYQITRIKASPNYSLKTQPYQLKTPIIHSTLNTHN